MSSSSDSRGSERPALAPEQHAISGSAEYDAAVDRLIERSLGRIRIFDRQLGPAYNTRARSEVLRRFLLAARANRLEIVLHDAERIRSDCPRLVTLQRHFPHAIRIHRTLPPARGVYDPFCVIDGSHYARRFHFDNPRGILMLNDAEGAKVLVQRFAEIWEASQPAITGTTLGL